MGLFDNPEYFQENARAAAALVAAEKPPISHIVLVENTIPTTTAASEGQQQQQVIDVESTPSTYDRAVSTPLLTTGNTPIAATARTLFIVKIIITVCFGYMINQLILYSLAFTVVDMKYHSTTSTTSKNYYVQLLSCILAGPCAIMLAVMLLWIWKPKKISLFVIGSLLFLLIVVFSGYLILLYNNQFSANDPVKRCKSDASCMKDFIAILIMVLDCLASVVLVSWEYFLIK